MATRNVNPRADGEGNLGTITKAWLAGAFKSLNVLGALILSQIAKPANPSSGKNKLYFKSDDNLYKLNSAGVEAQVDAASSADMEKSTYDTDDDGIVDKSESLDDGVNNVTAQEAQDHLDNTSNPHSVDKTDVSLNNVDNVQQIPLSYIDTDGTLAANSDSKVSSQKAGKTYIDALLGANDAMVYKGVVDCNANPNYPAADAGHTYRISVAGKIGGASGETVEVGDIAICIADSTASGDQAAVGEFWNIIQVNIDGAVVAVSPFISVNGNIPKYNGATGRIIEDSGVAMTDVSGHIADSANPHSVEADQIASDDSGETVQNKIDDADAHIADTGNPHSTTKAHVGLTDVPDLDTTDAVNHVSDSNNPHSIEADQIATDDSGVNVQEALDDIESDVDDIEALDLELSSITFIIDGGGSEITTGIKGDILVPFDCTISQVTLLADQSGSIVVDIWKDSYANFPPIDGDSITSSAPPTISTATKSQDSTLTDWTKTISAGQILRFNVDSVTDIERVTLTLNVTRT